MPVKLAKTAGFCMGVRRAMNAVLDASHKAEKRIYTLGPLVHNNQAMEMLESKDVRVVSAGEEVDEGRLYIRAHGIAPEKRASLDRPGVEVVDMTCPHVRRAQMIVGRHAKNGYHSIIVGDAGHAEVEGLLGHAGGRGWVVASAEEVAELPAELEPVCVVAQTTQNARRFQEIVPLLEERYPGAEVHNTVCRATDDRQEEVRTLAREVDAVVVVGGRHSANTVRLAEIAREEDVPTYHIETAAELDAAELRGHETVGITAGASTPHWVFGEVVDSVEESLRNRAPWARFLRGLLGFGVHSYLYIGTGSAATTYAALRLLDIEPRLDYLLLTLMYVVSMHIVNCFTDRAAAKLNDPQRMRLLGSWPRAFLVTAILLGGANLVLASMYGRYAFLFMLFSLVAGIGYNLQWIPTWLSRRIGAKAVREIPGSKDFFLALAWATVAVILPCLIEREVPAFPEVCVFLFLFLMVFIRSLVFSISDVEGDRIVGKETFPLVMGLRATQRLVVISLAILFVIACLDIVTPWSAVGGILLLPVCAYVALYLYLAQRRRLSRGVFFEVVVDAQFILTGLLAYSIPHG